MAYEQERFWRHGLPEPLDGGLLGGLVKVDQYVPAEYHVEVPLP